jgi:uncharacterized protein YjbI with pentapeptide repeats
MTNPDRRGRAPPAALLRRILDHQRWLNTNGAFGKQLVGSEILFEECDLDGVDLSRAEIEYAYFNGGNVRSARFVGTCLFNATFDGCDIDGADFSNANLRWANVLTNPEKAHFEGADLTRTAWTKVQMDRNFKEFATRRSPNRLWPRNTLEPR